jgi:hypothetical protein
MAIAADGVEAPYNGETFPTPAAAAACSASAAWGGRSGVSHGDAGWHTLAVQGHTPSVRAQAQGTPTFMAMLSHDIDLSFCLFIALLSLGTQMPPMANKISPVGVF